MRETVHISMLGAEALALGGLALTPNDAGDAASAATYSVDCSSKLRLADEPGDEAGAGSDAHSRPAAE